MFRQLKNIDTAFRFMRHVCIAVIICYSLILGWAIYKSYSFSKGERAKVFVLYNGKVLEAYAADRKDNIPVEAKDHVRSFIHDFFSLDPDEKVIDDNMAKAFYLSDVSAKRIYDNLKESGYLSNLISGNISQQVTVDSVNLDLNQYPYYFRCFAHEELTRPTSITYRTLLAQGYLRNVARSDHNSHGFLIERFEILDNHDIKTQNR